MSGLTPRIEVPAVFQPLWTTKARYKGAWGGRGGGKSHDRAAHLIVECISQHIRAVCLREVQNSIKDSVKQLIEDKIAAMGLLPMFEILRDEIRCHPTNSLIVFRGMRDMNADSIKSLEGFNRAWWEEAQTASERSLQMLTPTMRTPDAEMWFTWNPGKRTDPVDILLRQNPPDGAVVVRANWGDNPWFPAALMDDMARDREANPDRAAHVWDGAYEATSSAQLIPGDLVAAARKRAVLVHRSDETIIGVDVARFGDDRSVIYIRRGRDARSIEPQIFERMDTMQFASRVAAAINVYRPDAVFVDEGGVGGGVVDRLRQLNYRVVGVNFGGVADGITQEKAANKRSEMWLRMRDWLRGEVSILDSDALELELTGPLYSYNAQNEIVLERKDDMKKRGLRSPDLGDALALTFAYPVSAADEDDWEAPTAPRQNVAGY